MRAHSVAAVASRSRLAGEHGQSTVEWIGLILVVSAAFAFLAALVGLAIPGIAIGRAVTEKIICAVGLSEACLGAESGVELAYGSELAALISGHAPAIVYEKGMKALPVDYRRCREDACADGAERGEVTRSLSGEPVTLFVHVADCRAEAPEPAEGVDCSGERAGNVYLYYYSYYPGSATGEGSTPLASVIRDLSTAVGEPSYHPDDWEALQIRIGPEGVDQRASSHHSYGVGWVPETGYYFVSGGSHAGDVYPGEFERSTPSEALRLIALGPIAATDGEVEFAVTPPWLKKVWSDPEYDGTD